MIQIILIHTGGRITVTPVIEGIIIAFHPCIMVVIIRINYIQVPALLLVSAAAVCLDVARENHQTATVIDCATFLKIAALMQSHCVR